MRIMGLDFGDKTVGVALTDELLMTAQPLETICRERWNKFRKTLKRLDEIISEYNVEKIVIGKPLNMDDTEGERIERTRIFEEELRKRTGLEIIEVDERLTTVEADEILDEMGVPRSERKQYIDKIAATIIMESYLQNTSSVS